ncbi:unnamed protein product [Heterobilharzia americana]|nr:unnamed protein product [Heterobilharzia americana]CAH8446143.1 unnamed protein product [Heterobilharzia americana]
MEICVKKRRIVLMPIDGSGHSLRAFQWYLDNLRNENDELHFVLIIQPIFATPTIELAMASPPVTDIMQSVQENIEDGKRILKKYLLNANNLGIVCQAFIHVGTKLGSLLVKISQEQKTNLIVMGTRGLGIIGRTILGSVTNYVLHHAKTPLVVVPPPVKQ